MDVNKFCAHIQADGFLLAPSEVKVDGRWHNIKLVDNANGRKAGAYKILNDSVAFYKNWRTGECKSFSDNTVVNQYGKETLAKLIKYQEYELKKQYFEASKTAYEKYKSIENITAAKSEYLIKKQVGCYGCKIDSRGNLVIPFANERGYIRTLQTITPDGIKLFEKNAEVKGNFHKIGFNPYYLPEKYYRIFVGEGYATMASIYEATKSPCVVAANSGNLKPVIEKLVGIYTNAEIVICADNDLALREINPGSGKFIWSNPGVEAAIECEKVFDCKIIIPDFSNCEIKEGLTDFNDLHTSIGIDQVKNQVRRGLDNYKNNTQYNKGDIMNEQVATLEHS